MFRKKTFFVVFEGIEGSGKTYHCKKLYRKITKLGVRAILTREPGGLKTTKHIRKILLSGKKNKFNKITDLLLYLASRSEHVEKIIKPSMNKKKIIICDRFVDSTIAYQVYGQKINQNIVDHFHREILGNIRPDLTFLLKINVDMALKRIKKRKFINRYDKQSKKFYIKAQKGYLNLAKKNKRRYIILDTSKSIQANEKQIYDSFLERMPK